MRMFAFLIIGIVAVMTNVHAAQPPQSRFCIIPVKDGTPTEADVNQAYRMVKDQYRGPGFPQPIFTPLNRGGEWTIDEDRRYEEFTELSPLSFLDNWKVEPWSNRVVITLWHGKKAQIIAHENNSQHFKAIDTSMAKDPNGFHGPYVLPSRKETVVLPRTTKMRYAPNPPYVAYVIGEDKLSPWPLWEELKSLGIKEVQSLHDASLLGGLIIRDQKNALQLYQDGQLQKLAQLPEKSYGNVVEFPNQHALIFRGTDATRIFQKTEDTDKVEEHILTRSQKAKGSGFYHIKQHDQMVWRLYEETGSAWNPFEKKLARYRWMKLGNHGLEDISGSPVQTIENPDKHYTLFTRVYDAPSVGLTIIREYDRFYTYDSNEMKPISGSELSVLGPHPDVVDSPSIGRTLLVSSEKGLFEITKSAELIPINTPFNATGLPPVKIVDWSDAGVALIASTSGFWTVNSQLEFQPVQGGEQMPVIFGGVFVTPVHITGDYVIKSKETLSLVVDTFEAGKKICNIIARPSRTDKHKAIE